MTARTEVVFVDGVRTPFGRAGEKGMYWQTRADDLIAVEQQAAVPRLDGAEPECSAGAHR